MIDFRQQDSKTNRQRKGGESREEEEKEAAGKVRVDRRGSGEKGALASRQVLKSRAFSGPSKEREREGGSPLGEEKESKRGDSWAGCHRSVPRGGGLC
jgi:hypothetical protein